MKALILTALLVVSSSAMAWNDPYSNNNYNNNYNQGYQSSTGTNYQYDLSTPGGEIGYSVDPAAQIRDSISVSPSRSIDKGLGQYGGGIYNN